MLLNIPPMCKKAASPTSSITIKSVNSWCFWESVSVKTEKWATEKGFYPQGFFDAHVSFPYTINNFVSVSFIEFLPPLDSDTDLVNSFLGIHLMEVI